VGIGTLLRYLTGGREAILEIAGNRHALWVGLLFVLSAGLAREYDGEDLLNEPWHLVLPLGASLVSSFLLFTVAYGAAILKGENGRAFFPRYLAFLGLFWLTAPLAWLYAIPYERFCTPVEAVRLNLITLGFVSAWRVVLMTRVLTVLMGWSVAAAVCLVLTFADMVALVLMNFLRVPLLDVMGGLRLSESERLVKDVALTVGCLGFLMLPLFLVVGLVFVYRSKAAWQASASAGGRPRLGLVVLAVGSVLVWLPILPYTQPEQQRRRIVEKLAAQGERVEALRYMSSHPREAFPPHWVPPRPDLGYLRRDYLDWLEDLSVVDTAPWVRETYIQMYRDIISGSLELSEKELEKFAKLLETTTEGRAILKGANVRHPYLADLLRDKAKQSPVPPR
jgi:hypothetical protein